MKGKMKTFRFVLQVTAHRNWRTDWWPSRSIMLFSITRCWDA